MAVVSRIRIPTVVSVGKYAFFPITKADEMHKCFLKPFFIPVYVTLNIEKP